MWSGSIGHTWTILGCLAALAITPALFAEQDSSPDPRVLFRAVGAESGGLVIESDAQAWARAINRDDQFVIEDFPLGDGRSVDLEMQRFHIVSQRTPSAAAAAAPFSESIIALSLSMSFTPTSSPVRLGSSALRKVRT